MRQTIYVNNFVRARPTVVVGVVDGTIEQETQKSRQNQLTALWSVYY